MAEKYPVRLNLRLSEDTYRAYKDCADELGQEVTSLVREFVDNGVPAVNTLEASAKALKAGRLVEGTSLYGQLVRSVMSSGQLWLQQTEELEAEVKEIAAKKEAPGAS